MSDVIVQYSLSVSIVSVDTGEIYGQHLYESLNKDEVVNSKRLANWIASFQRGCDSHDSLAIQIEYDKKTIF